MPNFVGTLSFTGFMNYITVWYDFTGIWKGRSVPVVSESRTMASILHFEFGLEIADLNEVFLVYKDPHIDAYVAVPYDRKINSKHEQQYYIMCTLEKIWLKLYTFSWVIGEWTVVWNLKKAKTVNELTTTRGLTIQMLVKEIGPDSKDEVGRRWIPVKPAEKIDPVEVYRVVDGGCLKRLSSLNRLSGL